MVEPLVAPPESGFPGVGQEWPENVQPTTETPPPDAAAQGEGDAPAAATPDRTAELEAQIQQLTTRLETTEGRLQDTQAWGHNNNLGRQLAHELINAQAEQRRIWEQQQVAQRELQPPTLTDEEKAELITNPDLLWKKVQEVAGHMARSVLTHIDPRLRAGEIMYQLGQPTVELLAERAFEKARELAKTDGLAPEEFNQLEPHIYQVMQAAAAQTQDPIHYTRMALNPQAIAMAARLARTQIAGGPPVRNPATPPPTIGSGNAPPRGGGAPVSRPPLVGQIEKTFNVKISDKDLRDAAEKGKAYDAFL